MIAFLCSENDCMYTFYHIVCSKWIPLKFIISLTIPFLYYTNTPKNKEILLIIQDRNIQSVQDTTTFFSTYRVQR